MDNTTNPPKVDINLAIANFPADQQQLMLAWWQSLVTASQQYPYLTGLFDGWNAATGINFPDTLPTVVTTTVVPGGEPQPPWAP